MSNIDKQALRQTAEKAQEHGVFNMDIHSETVLALLDELEAKGKRIAEQADIIANQDKWVEAVEATMISATDRAEAAEKRITELEEREVKLPKPISVLHRSDFADAHRSIYAYPEAEVNAALADAGIIIAAAGKGEAS